MQFTNDIKFYLPHILCGTPDRPLKKKYVKFTSTSRVANFTCKQTARLYTSGDGVEIQSDPSQETIPLI